jgi:hypothetical protein
VERIRVKSVATGAYHVTQAVDEDGDGRADILLFQTDIAAKGKLVFECIGSSEPQVLPNIRTFGRFVPERIDDFAWENDRVAFRTYGPKAQQITESGAPGGTLSSGMDCWLKSVPYPIIDTWYRRNVETPGAYHVLTEEGYDPYHVGSSRGCGGIGVWMGDTLWASKNFISYKVLANGPIRTLFELTYAPWTANGISITETKRISLDLGSNLTRFEIQVQGSKPLPNITAGITLHDQKGTVRVDAEKGWFRHWEPMDVSEMGEGIVVPKMYLQGYKENRVSAADQSQLLVFTKPIDGRVVYYAGFGWKKSGQFSDPEAWDTYLNEYAARIAAPLQISFK